MNKIGSFFGIGKNDKELKETTESSHRRVDSLRDDYEFSNGAVDPKSLQAFRRSDLARSRFCYDRLIETNWWPDQILSLLEILVITYNQFINCYRSDVGSFDGAIRNAIYFMNQKKYVTAPAISKFVNHGDFKIVDGYLAAVIAEDNCYMRESDDRKRSPNEYKHHLLSKALETLLTMTPIKDGELVLKREYEEKLRTFLTIYNLKNIYAVTDDTLRTVLVAMINNTSLGIDLKDYFHTIIEDINQRVLIHFSKHHDEHLFNSAHTFRDLMLCAYLSTQQFHHTIHLQNDGKSVPSIRLRPMVMVDEQTILRVEYVYSFYLQTVNTREVKKSILYDSNRFEELMSNLDSANQKRPSTPRYLPHKDDSLMGETGLFVLESAIPPIQTQTYVPPPPSLFKASKEGKNHQRKISLDRIVVRRSSFREDLMDNNERRNKEKEMEKIGKGKPVVDDSLVELTL